MSSRFILYRQSRIHYRLEGEGKQQVICFHGFGESSSSFDAIMADLPSGFQLIVFDLPCHGETVWAEGLNFDVFQLQEILGLCADILPGPYTLMGFSLGARVALRLYQADPRMVSRLVLLAPDGIKINPWYWLSTQTSAGNKLFRFFMYRPGGLATLIIWLGKLNLINKSILRFVQRYLDDPEMRAKVYEVWTTYRKFKPDLSIIREQIRLYQTPVRLLYGRHDRIIPSSQSERFVPGLENMIQVITLDCGHQVLHQRQAEEISRALRF